MTLTTVLNLLILPLAWAAVLAFRRFLKQHFGRVLEALFWAVGKVFNESLARRVSLRQYARIQLAKKSKLQFLTVPGVSDTKLPLDNVFVPLRLEDPSGHGETRTHLDFATPGARVRIIGDPGSGKSSLVRRVFRDECKRAKGLARRDETGKRRRAQLPILIDLKEFAPPAALSDASQFLDWALEQLRHSVIHVRGFDMPGMFDAFLTGPGLLLLLDGLDEVAGDSYSRAAETICALSDFLADTSDANTIVLTMRSQFHHQISADFDERFLHVLHIEPFTPADVYTFLTLWPFSQDVDATVTRIYAELTDRPTLRGMCRNPLVLAMYVANDQRGGATNQADVRTAFYDQVVAELLVNRRSRQRQTSTHNALLRQREAILGRLAYENVMDDARPLNVIPREAAITEVSVARSLRTAQEGDNALDEIIRETGIIDGKRPGDTVYFIHLSFCEFLAAKYVARYSTAGWSELLERHKSFQKGGNVRARTRLVEVLPFAVALLPESAQSAAVEDVARLADQRVLGRCFLETQIYDHRLWPAYIDAETQALRAADPEDWHDDWLQRLQLFSVVLRDAEGWAELMGKEVTVPVRGIFRDLVSSDRDRLSRIFSSFAIQDPAATFRLAEATGLDLTRDKPELVIDNASDPPFLITAVQSAFTSPAASRRWAPLLVEAALRHPAAAALLHARAAPPGSAATLARGPDAAGWAVFDMPAPQRLTDTVGGISCYGIFIAIAMDPSQEALARYPCLAVLRTIDAPSVKRPGGQWLSMVGLAGLTGAGLYGVIYASVSSWTTLIVSELIFGPALIGILSVFIARTEGRRLYRLITNLVPYDRLFEAPASLRFAMLPQLVARRVWLRRLDGARRLMLVARSDPLPTDSARRNVT